MQTMQLFVNHCKNVTEIANVLSKEFVNYAIGLMIISYQFIFVKIKKLNIFFSVGKKTYKSLS